MSAPLVKFSELKGFPDSLEQNGKIRTIEFIDASNEIIAVMAKFGKLFSPVVTDMRGNSRQLHELYQTDEKMWEFMEDMILHAPQPQSRSWILWLKRALEMLERFFYYVMNDPDVVQQKSDSLQPMLNKAYSEVLKPYHGFLLRNTFTMLNRWVPTRKSLLGDGDHFHENIQHLRILMPKMRKHIDKIDVFLKENGFDDNSKV